MSGPVPMLQLIVRPVFVLWEPAMTDRELTPGSKPGSHSFNPSGLPLRYAAIPMT